jgi:hypothetical protein
MHYLLNLLRIKGLYMFRALLAYPQEALHKRQFVYSNIPSAVCSAPAEDEQVIFETCRGPYFLIS